jgi:hypothetical protein
LILISHATAKKLIGESVEIRFDLRSGNVAIPREAGGFSLYMLAELLNIPDWIDVVHCSDFLFCSNLHAVSIGPGSKLREIHGFRECPSLERVEPSLSVDVIGRDAFQLSHENKRVFLTLGDASWLWRRRRGCRIFIAGKSPGRKEEKLQAACSEVIADLAAKCDGNVHTRAPSKLPRAVLAQAHATDLVSNSLFCSENEPKQWIYFGFKTLRIEPSHSTIRTDNGLGLYPKSWRIHVSADGPSWTEIDRREDNSDLNDGWAMKTFAASQSGTFDRICLRQIGLNHSGLHHLVLTAFKLFGTLAGLQ